MDFVSRAPEDRLPDSSLLFELVLSRLPPSFRTYGRSAGEAGCPGWRTGYRIVLSGIQGRSAEGSQHLNMKIHQGMAASTPDAEHNNKFPPGTSGPGVQHMILCELAE